MTVRWFRFRRRAGRASAHCPFLPWFLNLALILVLGAGCATPTGDPWMRLEPGMTYSQVQRLIGPGDPELNRALQDAGDQQRAMEREHWEIRARAKQAGGVWIPPMTSDVTVTSGDSRMRFKDGRLESWARGSGT